MIDLWSRSGHADRSAEAFSHWNSEGEIPPECSICHSGAGFRSFLGLDGSPRGLPDHPIPIGGVVDCETCHNPKLSTITEITFPSGAKHPVVGVEAACMSCHQGRESGLSVAKAIEGKGDDTPDPTLRFINPHYKLAAATFLGGYGAGRLPVSGQDLFGPLPARQADRHLRLLPRSALAEGRRRDLPHLSPDRQPGRHPRVACQLRRQRQSWKRASRATSTPMPRS